jgi:hypothetical protein
MDQKSILSTTVVIKLSTQPFTTEFTTRRQRKWHPKMKNSSLVFLKSSGTHAANTAVLSTVVYQYATTVGISSDVKTSQRISTDSNLPRDG